jgi:hypothetical protein
MNNTVAPAASTAAIANKQQPNMALDGSEVSKGPDQSIGSASNSVTQPIGID